LKDDYAGKEIRLELGRVLAFLRFPVEIKFAVKRKLLVTFAQRK